MTEITGSVTRYLLNGLSADSDYQSLSDCLSAIEQTISLTVVNNSVRYDLNVDTNKSTSSINNSRDNSSINSNSNSSSSSTGIGSYQQLLLILIPSDMNCKSQLRTGNMI